MTFHSNIIQIKSVFQKDKNSYYYNILLEKPFMNYLKNKIFV